MNYWDYRDLKRSVNELNAKYGNFFGYKVLLYTVVAGIIFIFIVLGIQGLKKYKDHKEQFVLDSDRKYIISFELPETNSYYEVDFSKGEVIYRKDSSRLKREKIGKVRTDLKDLEQLLLNIVNDENNLVLSDEDRKKLYKENCYWIYKITTYEQKDYYIKDVNIIEHMKEKLSKI